VGGKRSKVEGCEARMETGWGDVDLLWFCHGGCFEEDRYEALNARTQNVSVATCLKWFENTSLLSKVLFIYAFRHTSFKVRCYLATTCRAACIKQVILTIATRQIPSPAGKYR